MLPPAPGSRRRFLRRPRSGSAKSSLLAFLRITTRTGIFERPLAPEHPAAYVDEWLDQPFVRIAQPTSQHWSILRQLLATVGTAGNLTSDAHLAALAVEHRSPNRVDRPRFRTVSRGRPLRPPELTPERRDSSSARVATYTTSFEVVVEVAPK